jgi:transcriptional regulator with GAF, ATPase, and Fis domain
LSSFLIAGCSPQHQITKLRLIFCIIVFSIIFLILRTEDKMVGNVVFHSVEEPKFVENDLVLVESLKGPMKIAMSNALKHREVLKLKDVLADDNRYLHGELRRLSGDEIIGAHFGLHDVMQQAGHVASLDSPVLLFGETGVGKDVIANAIHYSSNRKDGPFVSVNCGAIPESLIDSELFGHEKGAFTGALSQMRGRFERADTAFHIPESPGVETFPYSGSGSRFNRYSHEL